MTLQEELKSIAAGIDRLRNDKVVTSKLNAADLNKIAEDVVNERGLHGTHHAFKFFLDSGMGFQEAPRRAEISEHVIHC